MKSFSTLIATILLLLGSSLSLQATDLPIARKGETPKQLVLHNQVLAKINDKVITVLDIKKRLDFLFLQQFPNIAKSDATAFQFYQTNWKHVRENLINRELILADANDNKLPINDGDIRQELEEIFGPNIIENIDKSGMSFDEAWEMVKTDIAVRRMMLYRVHSKVSATQNPQELSEAYQSYAEKKASPEAWNYRLLSIRHKDNNKAKAIAEHSYRLLSEEKIPFSELLENLEESDAKDPDLKLTFSKEIRHTAKTLSPGHLEVLSKLTPKNFSKPVEQVSRATKSTVWRIFYLTDHLATRIPTLEEIEEELKDLLFQEAIEKESFTYIEGLKEFYGLKEQEKMLSLSEQIEPFSLR